ncbi:MAG: acyltransferase family protein [Thermoguttaceae bacterium]|jgi:peptidoglycan/LPS O-acetylase OafA/YrhL
MLSKSTLSPIVDLGRALAVTAIFYFHVGVNTHYPLSQYGHFAVGYFIVLAGLAYLCFSRTHVTDTGSYFRYFGDRLIALFPIFIIVNLLIFAASYVYPSGLGRPYNAVELILSSLGLSQYFGYRYLSVVMWFVPFILQVYLLLPLIEWLLSKIHPVIVLIAAFLLSFALTIPVCVYFSEKAEEICVNWSPIFRLPEVVLGVFLGMFFSQRARLPGGIVFLAVYIVASFCLLQSVNYLPIPKVVSALPWAGFLLGALITVIACLIFIALSWSAHIRSFRLLGNASFPFFLIHGIAIRFLYGKFGANIFIWLGYFLICWCASIILALFDRILPRHFLSPRKSK